MPELTDTTAFRLLTLADAWIEYARRRGRALPLRGTADWESLILRVANDLVRERFEGNRARRTH